MPVKKSIIKSILQKNRNRKFKNRKSFSAIEDRHNSIKIIRNIASDAVQLASVENRRYSLPKISIKDNKAIKTNPDGTSEIIAVIPSSVSRKYKVGEVFHARKH
jgi:hypothetical protein